MKAVMISIRPRWCYLIASGSKTVEVRKTRPKQLDEPFKVYIYCTKPDQRRNSHAGCFVLNDDELYRHPKEGICYGYSIELMGEHDCTADNFLNGKVIGEFICDRIDHFIRIGLDGKYHYRTGQYVDIDYREIGMTEDEMGDYLDGNGYGWHISDLKIYKTPKKLSDFVTGSSTRTISEDGRLVWRGMKRPPKSWCYVDDEA